MKLKATYIKIGRETIKGQRWLMLLNMVSALCVLPIFFLLLVGRYEEIGMRGSIYFSEMSESSVDFFETLIFSRHGIADMGVLVLLSALFLGALAGLSEYAFTHKKEKVDLLYSLPIKRGELFGLKTIIATGGYLITTLLGAGTLLVIASVRQVITLSGSVDFLVIIAIGTLCYLLGFFLAIIATQLTGKLHVAVLGIFTFTTFGFALWILVNYYMSLYYPSYLVTSEILNSVGNISPIHFIVTIGIIDTIDVLKLAGSVIILGVLSYYLVKKRPVERIGTAIIYKNIGSVIELILVMVFSLFTAQFFGEMLYLNVDKMLQWSIAGALVGALITYVFVEFIYGTSLIKLLKNSWKGVVIGGVVVGLICIMRYDITNANSHLPAYEEIKDINIAWTELAIIAEGSEFDDVSMGKSEELYEMIEIISEESSNIFVETGSMSQDVSVQFVLNNGKTIKRAFAVPTIEELQYSKYGEKISTLWENEEFLDFNYKLRTVPVEDVVNDPSFQGIEVYGGTLSDSFWSDNIEFLSNEASEQFLTILKKEYEEADGQSLLEGGIVGYVRIAYDSYDPGYISMQIPILTSFEKTIEYMKSYNNLGFVFAEDNISKIVIENDIYTSKEEIAEEYKKIQRQDSVDFRYRLKLYDDIESGYAVIDGIKITVVRYE